MLIEIEIKYTVPSKLVINSIVKLTSVADYTTVDRDVKLLTDTYFDTPDYTLFYS